MFSLRELLKEDKLQNDLHQKSAFQAPESNIVSA
jgi:hypothetical protein